MKAAHLKQSKKMITKIETWKTDDNLNFDSEVEALRHENEQLKQELDKSKWHKSCQTLTDTNQNSLLGKFEGNTFIPYFSPSQMTN